MWSYWASLVRVVVATDGCALKWPEKVLFVGLHHRAQLTSLTGTPEKRAPLQCAICHNHCSLKQGVGLT